MSPGLEIESFTEETARRHFLFRFSISRLVKINLIVKKHKDV